LKKLKLGIVLSMMISPKKTLQDTIDTTNWYYSLIVSGLAFGLFFLQTGLDLFKTGQKNFISVIITALIGLGYGIFVIPLLGILIWLIFKVFKSNKSITWAISTICLSYSGALIYGLVGLVFSLVLKWNTAIAFGVTGILWAIRPMVLSIKEMSNDKLAPSIIITTLVCVFVLVSWSFIGQI